MFALRNKENRDTKRLKKVSYQELCTHYWNWKESYFNFTHVRLCDLDIPQEKWLNFFANSGDPDLGLCYLPFTLLGISRLKLVKNLPLF